MARGYPDYNNPVYSLASKNIDFGLLAHAIMGFSSMDGRGRVDWFENWREGAFRWILLNAGDATPPRLTTLVSYIPPVSLELKYGSVAGGGSVDVYREFAMFHTGVFGLEFSLRMTNLNNQFLAQLRYYTAAATATAQVIIQSATGNVLVNDGGVNRIVTNILDHLGRVSFVRLKLVVDYTTGYYVRLLVGDKEFDISAYQVWNVAAASTNLMDLYFEVTPTGAPVSSDYLGHVLFTTDEP